MAHWKPSNGSENVRGSWIKNSLLLLSRTEIQTVTSDYSSDIVVKRLVDCFSLISFFKLGKSTVRYRKQSTETLISFLGQIRNLTSLSLFRWCSTCLSVLHVLRYTLSVYHWVFSSPFVVVSLLKTLHIYKDTLKIFCGPSLFFMYVYVSDSLSNKNKTIHPDWGFQVFWTP